MAYQKYIFIIIFALSSHLVWGQENVQKDIPVVGRGAVKEVFKSLEEGKSDAEVAESYEKLAKELSAKRDYTKAEDYLKRARALYVKLNNKDKIAAIDRELAKLLESQNRISEAISNFNSAGVMAKSSTQKALNRNDAQRLMNSSSPKAQQAYIQQNIELLEENKPEYMEDRVLAFQQMAQTKIELNDKMGAINDLQVALETVKDKPEEAIKINNEIARAYLDDNKADEAIEINKRQVKEAQKINDPKVEITQLQTLSSTYFEANKSQEGLLALQQAYDVAVKEGRTLDAKNSLELLVDQYKKEKKPQQALEAYANFMDRFESLVKEDSTLIDDKIFQVQEEKISQLEKERALKDKLINQANMFNYVLLISIIIILISLFFIARALYSIKKKNKKIALQSLRREMNPHFIFNSLNSVNQFIAQNNELEANKYLSSYSKLMWNIMENSNKDFIPLSTEMEQMKEYLDLEYMRFHDKFEYKIDVDDTIDADAVFIPNMLIQPQLENAIWHGLRYKDGKGLLTLNIKQSVSNLVVIVEDDGIGLTKSKELKTKHQKQHQSRGLTNTYERINLLNSLYGTDISVDIVEKQKDETGVIVTLIFPLMDKNK